MNWIQITITTTSAGIEPVTGRLYRLGITGTEIEDEQAFAEFLEDNRAYWDYVDDELRKKMAGATRVKTYVTDDASGRETVLAIQDSMRELKKSDVSCTFGDLTVAFSGITEEDWAENWKQYFKPLEIGRNILVNPRWEPLPAGAENKTVFVIEPGMVFGTGTHESTRMCIEAEEQYIRRGDRVLDLGCGSGILSLIALLLGAKDAVAVDIDPSAQNVAYENARLNGIGRDRFRVLTGDILTDEQIRKQAGSECYDVVFANIVADVVIALAPMVPKKLKRDGILIASGIIRPRLPEVQGGLRKSGLEIVEAREQNGWAAVICRRKL